MQVPRLIIVGASGLIGSALMRAAAAASWPVMGTALTRPRDGLIHFDMAETALRSAVPDLRPSDVVILLAGYISPAWIFANPEAAHRLNLDCSKRLVDDVDSTGARLVFMSTDQVFDGETGGYDETSEPRPMNLYGRLKAAMEAHVLATPNGIIARTGWNVGWGQGQHCPVVQCYEGLLRPNARMAFDNFFNITDVDDTARALFALATDTPVHRIYHLVSAPEVSRAELARWVAAASLWGAEMNFEAVPFSSIPYSEPRPTRAFLRSCRLATLGIDYIPPEQVVRRKVALIDEWRAAAGVDLPRSVSISRSENKAFPRSTASGGML
jgi:dTDP-4-dehydrorhamnose reductase